MFIHAAQTDRLTNDGGLTNVPTIWDSLAAAGVSRAYYYSNVPYITLWGQKYLGITKTFSQFQQDAANGTLPSVSFVDPRYTLLDDGTGADHHPHADIRNGDKFLYDVFKAVSTGPGWPGTVLIINFDEWGGFFDHVPPPRAQAANQTDTDIIDGKTLLGMRIPVVVASPWSIGDPTNPTVNSLVFDHTSVLKLIEWRWGLQPLTPRDASNDINNLAHTLNFLKPRFTVPPLPDPQTPASVPPCNGGPGDLVREDSEFTRSSASARKFSPGAQKSDLWSELRSLAQNNGFTVQ
jgi:phospholipase C